jgi:hypothetical protein
MRNDYGRNVTKSMRIRIHFYELFNENNRMVLLTLSVSLLSKTPVSNVLL